MTGSGLLNDVTVQGFTTGLDVSTTGVVTVTNSDIATNATGISLANGTLSATTVTVDGGSGNGVVIKAATGASSTLNATGLTVKNMTAAGISQSATGSGLVALNLTSAEITFNGGGGITLAAGTGTLGNVSVHDNTGAGITQSGGTLALGDGGATMTVQSNTTTGATLTGGTLTVGTTASITGNGTDGVAVSNSATLIANPGAHFTSNGANGINATSANLTFNGSTASPIIVTGNKADGILMSDGNLTSSHLTLSTNGTGTTKKSGLEITGAAQVVLGTDATQALTFAGSGLHGVVHQRHGRRSSVVSTCGTPRSPAMAATASRSTSTAAWARRTPARRSQT